MRRSSSLPRRKVELQELARSLPGGARRHKVIVSDLARRVRPRGSSRPPATSTSSSPTRPCPRRGGSRANIELSRALRVNFESPIAMARALAQLAERGEGHPVFISSLSGKVVSPRSSVYNATKFGLRDSRSGSRGSASARRRRLDRLAGLRARGRDVRRLRHQAGTRTWARPRRERSRRRSPARSAARPSEITVAPPPAIPDRDRLPAPRVRASAAPRRCRPESPGRPPRARSTSVDSGCLRGAGRGVHAGHATARPV